MVEFIEYLARFKIIELFPRLIPLGFILAAFTLILFVVYCFRKRKYIGLVASFASLLFLTYNVVSFILNFRKF